MPSEEDDLIYGFYMRCVPYSIRDPAHIQSVDGIISYLKRVNVVVVEVVVCTPYAGTVACGQDD